MKRGILIAKGRVQRVATTTVISLLVVAAFVPTAIAPPPTIVVMCEEGVTDETVAWLLGNGSETSDLVQLINAGSDKTINPPDEIGNTTGDDSLICDIRIGEGYGPPDWNKGKFSHGLSLESGTVIYCRAWNAASPSTATYYGDSSTMTVTGAGDYDFGTWSTNTRKPSLIPPNITSFAPPSPVSNKEDDSRTFNISVNQTVNVTWQINGSSVQTNMSITEASYTNTSAVIGYWNVSAIASNANGSDIQIWWWTVREDCDKYDGWYDTGDTRWITDPGNECKEKEQKEQEYRDYTCSEGACVYSVTGTQWVDTGAVRNKPDGTICGCTANNTLKKCCAGSCYDTGICNSTYCDADAACDGKKPGEVCGIGSKCNSTCNCVVHGTAPPNIISFAPPSHVSDAEGATRTFNITINQTVNVSWQINGTEVQTNESVTSASYTNASAAPGVWNVSAIASNANGTAMQMWWWIVLANTPPTASFTFSPPYPFVGHLVTFNGSDSSDPDGFITSYEWNFGDGNTSTEMVVTHSYSSAGTYAVTLEVTDDGKRTGTKTIDVQYGEQPTLGDVNGDGYITSSDTAIALDIAVGSRPFDDAADMSRDGTVTSLDALMILQAGLEI